MQTTQAKPFGALLYPLIWVVLGPFMLLLTAVSIALARGGWMSIKNLMFGLLLLATLLGRWSDFCKGGRKNSSGDFLPESRMWEYTTSTVMLGVTLWVTANVFGH